MAVREIVLNVIKEKCGKGQNIDNIAIHLHKHLSEVGLNSISFVETIVTLETKLGIEFEERDLDFSRFKTFQHFVDYVEQKCQVT